MVLKPYIVLLTPDNTRFLGGVVDHLEAEQAKQFVAGLSRRLGKLLPGEEGEEAPVAVARHPLPIQQEAATAQVQPARRRPTPVHCSRPGNGTTPLPLQASQEPTIQQNRIIKPDPSSAARNLPTPPLSQQRPARAARQQASNRLEQLYQQPYTIDDDMDESYESSTSFNQQSRTPAHMRQLSSEQDYNFDVDDSFIREVDEAELQASGRIIHDFDDDNEDDGYEVNDSFIRQIDEVEARVGKRARLCSGDKANQSGEVIEISD